MAAADINVHVGFVLKQRAEAKHLTPNAETKAALDEYEEMKKNPGNYERYDSFDELLNQIFRSVYKELHTDRETGC